jgi:pimeloyl-ACP methyl ester carboxylesterase
MAEININGCKLHVQRLGNGRGTAVFLHGLIMDNLSSWYFTVANRVALDSRVVLFDLRGHGKSHRPESGYTVDEFVADIDGLLDALAVSGPVHLVGNSFGGLLAVSYAIAHPQRVKTMVLIDSHYATSDWKRTMAESLALQGEELEWKIAVSFKHWLGRNSKRKRSNLTDLAKKLVYGTTLVQDLEQSATVSDDSLSRIDCPVLGLYGEHSDVRAMGEHLAQQMPRFEFRLFPGCTHSVLWEKTDAVREQIAAWIATH